MTKKYQFQITAFFIIILSIFIFSACDMGMSVPEWLEANLPKEEEEPEHIHNWSDWKTSPTQHWKECLSNDGAESERANHIDDDNNNLCDTCGFDMSEEEEPVDSDGDGILDDDDEFPYDYDNDGIDDEDDEYPNDHDNDGVDDDEDEYPNDYDNDGIPDDEEEHIHEWSSWLSVNDTQHFRTCALCNETEFENHADGTDSDELCDTCGFDMSEPEHVHNWANWLSMNDTQHFRTCALCNEIEFANHADGTDSDELCDTCGFDMSEEEEPEPVTVYIESIEFAPAADLTDNNTTRLIKPNINTVITLSIAHAEGLVLTPRVQFMENDIISGTNPWQDDGTEFTVAYTAGDEFINVTIENPKPNQDYKDKLYLKLGDVENLIIIDSRNGSDHSNSDNVYKLPNIKVAPPELTITITLDDFEEKIFVENIDVTMPLPYEGNFAIEIDEGFTVEMWYLDGVIQDLNTEQQNIILDEIILNPGIHRVKIIAIDDNDNPYSNDVTLRVE
jgi:hypothetical protein